MNDVAVVGGGLAGLVAARRVAERDVTVTLYERADRLGGRVGSDRRQGFTLDRGFQVLFPGYPAVQRELDLAALDLQHFRPGAVIARPGERSILSDPLRDPRALTATQLNHEVTLGDAWRVFRLRRELRDTTVDTILDRGDRSIAEALAARGFSDGFVEAFAAPFLGGITLDRSLSSAEFVFDYAFKMLVESQASLPAGGMQAIPAQLADRARAAGVRIELDMPVQALAADSDGVELTTNVGTQEADAAVVATDPKTARELTDVDAIPTETRGCVTQHFSLPTTQDLPTGRRLVLNAADAEPNQVAVLSEVAPNYAPQDQQLLSATFLGEPDAGQNQLAGAVTDALDSWFPENSFADLELLSTHRVPRAQLAQPPGFRDGLPEPDAPDGPVVLAGDYTRWSSIQGALESGRCAVEALQID